MNDANNSSQDGTLRGPWMTPARARQLAAAAGDLYHQLREADLARDADPDPARRRAGWRLDVAAGGLHSPAEELLDTANELIRLATRRADACSVPWGVCPEHGATLRSTAGRCWCTAPGCLRRWFHNRLGEPCAEPGIAPGSTRAVGHPGTGCRRTTGTRHKAMPPRIRRSVECL